MRRSARSRYVLPVLIALACLGAALVAGGQQPVADSRFEWELAFVRDGDIWVANVDGTEQRRIIEEGQSPCWSPDRKRIAFARRGNIWVARADGGEERRVTSRPDEELEPRWSSRAIALAWDPVSDLIVFSAPQEYEVRRPGETETSLLRGNAVFSTPSVPGVGDQVEELLGLLDNGSHYGFLDQGQPEFSPAGRHLAFVCNGDIWWLTRGERWAPKEWPWTRWTLHTWYWEGGRLDATASYELRFYGQSRSDVTVTRLSWSPDGRKLAYGLRRRGGGGYSVIGVLDLDVARGGVRVLAKQDLDVVLGVDPCFSPDGKWIAYMYVQDGSIWRISVDGTSQQKLLENASQPEW